MNIIFVDDEYIMELNRKFKKRKNPTDVLAFPLFENKMIGEVYVSIDTAKRQSKDYNTTLSDELILLAVHGTLHILGYSHKKMEKIIKNYLK